MCRGHRRGWSRLLGYTSAIRVLTLSREKRKNVYVGVTQVTLTDDDEGRGKRPTGIAIFAVVISTAVYPV